MSEVAFLVRLTAEDWDPALRAWRCPALQIPGAVVDDVLVDGVRTDRGHYEVLQQLASIRWVLPDVPPRIAALVKLKQPLSLHSETDRWKKLAIVLPVAATVISAAISATTTYMVSKESVGQESLEDSKGQAATLQHNITDRTNFSVMIPRGDKVVITWDGMPEERLEESSGRDLLRAAGISLAEVNRGSRIAYAALARREPDTISFIPFMPQDGRALPGFAQAVVRPGPAPGSRYHEFQLFQAGNQFTLLFHPLTDQGPPTPPESLGVDWDAVKSGLTILLQALSRGRREFEFEGISTTTDPDGSWNYLLRFREI